MLLSECLNYEPKFKSLLGKKNQQDFMLHFNIDEIRLKIAYLLEIFHN